MRGRIIVPIAIIVMLTGSLLASSVVMSGASPTLYVEPASNTGPVNGAFSVNIRILDVPPEESLYSWEYHLRFNPSVVNLLHTRYFRSDSTLLTSQSGVAGSFTQSYVIPQVFYQLGIRVWKRDALGTETEITTGSLVSTALQKIGSSSIVTGAPWLCPAISLQPTDTIKVRVFGKFQSQPAWTRLGEWVTEPDIQVLDTSTWNAYYYVKVYSTGPQTHGVFFFGNATYNSRIEISGISKGAFLSDAASSQGWNTVSLRELDTVGGFVRMNEYIDPKNTIPALPPMGAVGEGILATIKFFVVGEGVTLLHFDYSELFTVIAGNSVSIGHKTTDGLFDNRQVILPPHAMFNAPLYGVEAVEITLDASPSNDAADGGWIVNYEWDFDYDGVSFDVEATGRTVTHSFPLQGTYAVALRVTDNDGLTDTVIQSIPIFVWMQGGWFPDLISNQAWPEHPKWHEDSDGRQPSFYAKVGNPTEEEYQVYAEFTIFSKDEAKKLGTVTTPITTIAGGQTLELSTVMDLADNMWRAFSGCPNPDSWNWLGYYAAYKPWDPFLMRRYTVFASCYYMDSSMSQFEQGYVVKYFHFNVVPAIHDIGIAQIAADPTSQVQGGTFLISLNVTNKGEMDETFDITLLYKGEFASGPISTRTVTLQPGESRIEMFTWDTAGLPLGTYIIKARVPACTYEWPKDLVDQEVLTVVYIIP